MLKITGVKLVKINSIDVHLFLEKGMRGASYMGKRYSKSDENTKMMYWNINDLYGSCMILDL